MREELVSWAVRGMGLAAGIALVYGLASVAVGAGGALLLGLIAAVMEVIPIVGPLLGAIPAVLVASTVSMELALVVAGVYVLLQFVEGSVLVPYVMRNTIGLSPFLVIVSLLVGAAAGGVVGALFAVPVAAAVLVVLERAQARTIPVAQDSAAVEISREDTDTRQMTLPDAAAGKS